MNFFPPGSMLEAVAGCHGWRGFVPDVLRTIFPGIQRLHRYLSVTKDAPVDIPLIWQMV